MTTELTVKKVNESDKKKALESALYYLTEEQAFFGGILQEMTIKYRPDVPTAGITFNQKTEQFEVYLNPDFFCGFLTTPQRIATLHHEVLHFTNKHLFRLPFMNASDEDRKLYNMAGDMAINQFIKDLPEGCIDVKNYKHKLNGKVEPFPVFETMEAYYELLKNNQEENKEQMGKYTQFDQHDWESMDEETKKQMLDEAKKILKRTMEKTQYSHSVVPDSLKDLLQEIEGLAASLNYKSILKNAIKKTVSCTDRESTWKRPNKRYGVASPGTKVGALPVLAFYNDSSGSISVQEQNDFLRIMDGFLKVGSRKCTLNFWHTNLYYKKPYKRGQQIPADELESGGTIIQCVMDDIKKSNPNLSIILTDGFYEQARFDCKNEVIFIISKGGNKDHPMKRVGKTIMLDSLR